MKALFSISSLALLIACTVGIPWAQNANRMMAADSGFMTKAAQGGMEEVELGKLAQMNASSDKVKQFGQRMVDDHSKANDELKSIAAQKGVVLPAAKPINSKLANLHGKAFDKAYMQDMVKDHKEDIALFKKEAASGQDAEIKQFASKTLPTLEQHLTMAEQTWNDITK